MNKYTARGLVEAAHDDAKKITVLANTGRDLTQALRELRAAVDDRRWAVKRERRAHGHELIEFIGGGEIRVRNADRVDLRSTRVDVVYFDFEPTLDIISACQDELAGTAWVELVRPT